MFICNKCLKKDYEPTIVASKSYGNCEICGETDNCADIPSRALVMKKMKTINREEWKVKFDMN